MTDVREETGRQSRPASRWARFSDQAQRDIKLWLAFAGLLALCRVALIVAFHDRMGPESGAGAVLAALANGLRFDGQTALLWTVPSLLLGIASAFAVKCERAAAIARRVAAGAFVFVTVILAVITFGYFREYDNQFDHFVLGVVYDDFGAVLDTVWKEYPVVWVVLGMLTFDAGLFLGIAWLVRRPFVGAARLERVPRSWRVALAIALVPALVVVMRGSVGSRPVQDKDVAVTADRFLNKTVVNAYKALEYAIKGHLRVSSKKGLRVYLPDGDIRAAVRRLVGEDRFSENLDQCLLRAAPGAAHPPRHVFLVVAESYSAWPLEPAYRELGVARELERLGAGSGSILLTRCLPASGGTMTSLATIMTGLAEPGTPICYQPNSRRPYATSLAPIFSRLGYRTRFFYGGYLSWQRMGDFAHDQGFEEVYGGGEMGGWLEGNEWGVPDERLFDFALSKIEDDRPSLNVFMTVSNHPPFDVDVYGRGFPLREMPAPLATLWDGEYTLKQIGHFWYADRCLGRFVDALEKKLPRTLVAVTGDHYGRRFLNSKPGLVERAFVPLLLRGPEALAGARLPEGASASHLDIPATLVELCAPAGFSYAAMGRSVFSPEAAAPAFGAEKAVCPGWVVELTDPPSMAALAPEAPRPDVSALEARQRDLRAVAWWRVLRGAELPKAASR